MNQVLQPTSHFIGIVEIVCKLYGLKPIPPEVILSLDRSRWTQARNLLSSYAERPVGGAVVDSFLDLRDMPINEQIVFQNYLEDSGAYNPNFVPVSASPSLSIPLIAGTASSKKSYLRIIGRLAPDLVQQDPRKALPVLYERLSIEDPKKYAPEKLTAMLTPMVDSLCENDDQIDSLNRTLSAVLLQHDIDPKKSHSVAGSLLIYQLGHPDATADQLEKYFSDHLLPQIEADKPLGEDVTKSLSKQLSESTIDHEQARLSNPAPDQETAQEYLKKLEQNTNKNLQFTSRELVVFSKKTGRPVFTDFGRAQADRFALSHLKNGQFDLNSALSEINSEKQKVRNTIQKMESGPITNYDDLIDLYQQQRYLNLSSSSLRLRQYHLSQKLKPDGQKITPLENELVAQFTTHGLLAKDARQAAREFINSGLAVSYQHLSSFVDSTDRKSKDAKTELFSQALSFINTKYPKLQNFNLNVGKFDKAFNSIGYFRDLLINPQALIGTYAQQFTQSFVKSLGEKYLSQEAVKTASKKLVGQAVIKFAGTEIGKQVLKRVGIEAAKLTIEAVAASTGVGLLIDVAIEVALALWNKVKDTVSWISRQVRENGKLFAAGIVALVASLIPGIGIGGATAAGAVTYAASSVLGGISQTITGNPSPALTQGARTINNILTAVVVETAADSVATVVIIIFSIPIVLALFLFIINTSAYLVSQSSGTSGIGGAVPMCWPVEAIITQDPCAVSCGNCSHKDGLDMNAFDLANDWGTPVYATHDGTVLSAIDDGYEKLGYGNNIIITSKDGTFYTLYAHLMTTSVEPGDIIVAGQEIGTMDSTGEGWTGAGTPAASHLHYELRTGNAATSNNQCNLVEYVPEGWTYPGSTTYDGTCYASSSGGGTSP